MHLDGAARLACGSNDGGLADHAGHPAPEQAAAACPAGLLIFWDICTTMKYPVHMYHLEARPKGRDA